MPSQFVYGIGENKEFSVATTGVITVFFYNSAGLTSANDDTANRNYYFDNQRVAKKYVLRTNQTIEITEIGSIQSPTITDPITVAIGSDPASGKHREEFDGSVVTHLKINILTTNTNLKLRTY